MNSEIDQLKNLWRNSRSMEQSLLTDSGVIIAAAKQSMRSTIKLQWGTILILVLTLVAISAFFIFVAKFKETISHLGMGLMLGGLAIRTAVELFSIYLSKTIDPTDLTLKTSYASIKYYRFRKTINGPVTTCILVLYTIGFYLLTPEFSSYIRKSVLIIIDLSYILGAFIVGWFIRNTINTEMAILKDVVRIHEDIIKSE